jgi:hypothetical protein
MKRVVIVTLAATALALFLGVAAGSGEEHHVRADLVAADGSGVSGFVEITQLPHGGSNLRVVARGLTAGTQYASFYYESNSCTEPADLLGNFSGGSDGEGTVGGKIDDDLDEVGSVSVRLGPGYGTLLACAKIH